MTVAVILGLTAVAVVFIFRFIDEEREREMLNWQARLGIVADSRAAAVEGWVADSAGVLKDLANNDALRLYLTRIKMGDQQANAPDSPEVGFLTNLIVVTAERTGFAAPPLGANVPANVPRVGVAGLALLDAEHKSLISTANFPPVESAEKTYLDSLAPGKSGFIDLYVAPSGRPTVGFIEPIYAVQEDPTPDHQIGVVFGLKPVDETLYPLLKQPGATERTAEAVLVRATGSVIEYLSPLRDGSAALKRKMASNTPGLAAAFALKQPGGFGIYRDYAGNDVLVTSRPIKGTPWTLMYKVDRKEALGESDTRLQRLLVILLLAVAFMLAALFALWRHGASQRAAAAADRFQEMAERFEHQRNFLRVVTDSQPNAIFIADPGNVYRFANDVAARNAGGDKDALLGKTLANVLGPDRAKAYEKLNRQALEEGKPIKELRRYRDAEGEHVLQSEHIPLKATGDVPGGVLVVEEDVTTAVTERERRSQTLRDLVATLMTVVDQRDPNAAHHSTRVAKVARAIAGEMGLDTTMADTAEFAGTLTNLGKILVPSELLTRKGGLTDAEIRQVRDSIQATADLLQNVQFDGPVVETLRQCQERWDGAGRPKGLAGDDILLPARIVAVANAFVAMVEPRAHRPGIDFDAAAKQLLDSVGTAYDRRVVA
ncbi:MAG: HD domain-containing phosphohydrolase, partial [Candidatus Eiseniibacteriota bacterium]